MPKLPKCKLPDLKSDMMFQMQLKFVAVAMAILIAVFLIMLSSINMMMQTVSQHQSMQLLIQIAESERYNSIEPIDAPPPIPEETPVPLSETNSYRDTVVNVQQLARRDWWDDDTSETQWWENNEEQWQQTTALQPEPPHRPNWTNPAPETMPQQDVPPQQPEPPPYESVPLPPVETVPAPPTDPPTEEVTQPPTELPTEPLTVPMETIPAELPITQEVTLQTTVTETTASTTQLSTTTTTTTTTTATTTHPEPPPKPDKWNLTITIDHFALLVGQRQEFLGLRNTEDYTDAQAEEIMHGILKTGEQQGMYGWLQYYAVPKEYGTLIVVTDKTSDQGLLNNLFRITIIVGCLMLLVLFVILCILSKWITRPVQIAFKRQKQFVSDAGHELKTPLAVLTANADVLQDEIGENKWLGYMQEQTARMNQLVGDLLHLARMDNATQEYQFAKFNLSSAINATALPFESQAFELNKNLELDIQSGLEYYGSEQHIRQLAAIFIDNAMKYSNENGTIKITLMKRGDKNILEFYNTGCEISQSETEKIFERFYRGDKARNTKGKNGYGLGLAIAKSIMDVHKIKIHVTCEQGKWIRFLLTL